MIQINRDCCPSCGKRLGELLDCDTSLSRGDKVLLALIVSVILAFLLFGSLEVIEALRNPCSS